MCSIQEIDLWLVARKDALVWMKVVDWVAWTVGWLGGTSVLKAVGDKREDRGT